jgi:hypothetical protein
MTKIIAVRDVENHKIYILPTADDKPVKVILEKDAKEFVDDATVYTKDAIYKVINEIKAVNGNLDKAVDNLIKNHIKLEVVSINERFCSKIPE